MTPCDFTQTDLRACCLQPNGLKFVNPKGLGVYNNQLDFKFCFLMGMGKLLPLMIGLFSLFAPTLLAQTDPNKRVYNFCVQHQGQQVGDGICQTLVDEALHSARASENHGFGKEVWRISSTTRGVVISGDYNKVLPGDIVYFHDIFPDRYRYKGASDLSLLPERQRSNHIGVVDSLTLDGVRYFDQNAGYQKVVKSDYFSFNDSIDVVDYVAIFRP